jgi:Fe-Mn family superoxide dismutase
MIAPLAEARRHCGYSILLAERSVCASRMIASAPDWNRCRPPSRHEASVVRITRHFAVQKHRRNPGELISDKCFEGYKEKTMLSRRRLVSAAGSVAAIALAQRRALAQTLVQSATPSTEGPFAVAPLPYPVSSLVPVISAETMIAHHGKHHAAYVSNLNDMARDFPLIGRAPPHELLANLGEIPDAIRGALRDSLGGHANHAMFWTIMSPDGGRPPGDLAAAIDRDLGGLGRMERDFDAAGGKVPGSGWVFVTVTREGRLAIETRPDEDTPLMEGKHVLFGNDVSEHAYYLDYRNRRDDYLAAWWNVVNWTEIGNRYTAAKAGTLSL